MLKFLFIFIVILSFTIAPIYKNFNFIDPSIVVESVDQRVYRFLKIDLPTIVILLVFWIYIIKDFKIK